MTVDNLMDALEYLDDDLIMESDRRRNYRRARKWLFPTIAAACICVVLIGHFWDPMTKEVNAEVPQDEANVECITSDSHHGYGNIADMEPGDIALGASIYEHEVIVKEFTEEGFICEIISDDGHEIILDVLCEDVLKDDFFPGTVVILRYSVVSDTKVQAVSVGLINS